MLIVFNRGDTGFLCRLKATVSALISYDEIYEIAEGTYNACLAWKQAVDALKAAQKAGG